MGSARSSDFTREAYGAHFGELFNFREVWREDDGSSPFLVLRFWTGAAPVVYASMGAAGHEIVLASTVPFAPFDCAVEELAGGAAAFQPLDVVPHAMTGSPFEAVLFLPPGEGTLDLGLSGGAPRHALRAVPLTRAERLLAREDLRKALDLLRKAGALVADPLRSCTVDPERTRRFWVHRAPWLLAGLNERLRDSAAYSAHLRARGAPPERIEPRERIDRMRRALVARIEAAPLGPRSHAEAAVARHRGVAPVGGRLIEKAIGPFRMTMSPWIEEAMTELMVAVLATHPESVRLLREAHGAPSAEAPRFDGRTIPLLADVAAGWHLDVDPEELVAIGQRACELARAELDVPRNKPPEQHLWGRVFGAMYGHVHAHPEEGSAGSSGERARITAMFQRVAESETLFARLPEKHELHTVEDDADERFEDDEDEAADDALLDDVPDEVIHPALSRLVSTCDMIVFRMMLLHELSEQRAALH
ncbi:uncharacterized protein SOCE26_060780 [Sorangium cellulosum]|uniref:Uncharacterized protein n=1 Tax=Sorangium cellulosum TaxID=56 RepID=A0A2L0EZ80_SORCE|nr:hypothetical protein [Sorangium cellulosum]AUX44612.1 uncharacterized protein SOCE26_060780 [Sorangium cellulosum]